MVALGDDPALAAFFAYVLAFGLAGVACFASVLKARRISDDDTRRGLVSLLVLCGGWSLAHVGFLVAPGRELQVGFYVVGLAVGFAAVGAWLYFCSAYTGRTLHRNPAFRKIAVATYLVVVALKVSNPLHGLYFSTSVASSPFPHLAVHHGTLHWIAMGLAYALATVGYFMLLERFLAVGEDTRPMIVLVGLTGLPLALDVIGLLSDRLIGLTYEPIGVAAFAVGVLYLYFEQFQAVQLAGSEDDPVVVLDADGRLREYNPAARQLFPELQDGIGEPLERTVAPLATALAQGEDIITVRREDEDFHYRLTFTQIGAGAAPVGRVVTIEDVTEAEESRRAVRKEKERLDRFASVVAHDLRNPLNVADGRIGLARETIDAAGSGDADSDCAETAEHLHAAADAIDRMETLIADLLTLAREGRDIGETSSVSLGDVARECWTTVQGPEATLVVEDDPTIEADPDRLRQLLENLFRNAVEHGSTSPPSTSSQEDAIEHGGDDVRIAVGALDDAVGFYVADDGPGIPEADREEVFAAGTTTNPEGTGFGLAIVEEIVDAHGWSISVTDADGGGARFEIRT